MKTIMFNLKLQIMSHPDMIAFLALLSSILTFIINTWQFNIILYFFLFLLVIIDTFTGIRRAKKAGAYDYRILKEKTISKVLGHLIFLLALGAFTIMLFVLNLNNTIINIPEALLNIPLMTAILFFAGVELLSINDNLKNAYGIKTPSSVIGKVERFVENQDISKLTNKDE